MNLTRVCSLNEPTVSTKQQIKLRLEEQPTSPLAANISRLDFRQQFTHFQKTISTESFSTFSFLQNYKNKL